jgi:hypothetical protein
MNQNTLFQNSSLQKAAEFSGVAGEMPLPQPASLTNL